MIQLCIVYVYPHILRAREGGRRRKSRDKTSVSQPVSCISLVLALAMHHAPALGAAGAAGAPFSPAPPLAHRAPAPGSRHSPLLGDRGHPWRMGTPSPTDSPTPDLANMRQMNIWSSIWR